MKPKRRGFVSAILVALVCLVIAMPVQGAVVYSKQCDTTWVMDQSFDVDQEYDGSDWDPYGNSSHGARFWQHLDDVNFSLEIFLEHDDIGYPAGLNFQYTVELTNSIGISGYKITEGASSTTNNQYQDTVSIAWEGTDDRDLYIDCYDVTYTARILITITVRVLDGQEIIDTEVVYYEFVGPV